MPRQLVTVPSPITDLVDWYWHANFNVNNIGTEVLDVSPPVDIRTARNIRGEDRTLQFIFEVNAAAGTGMSDMSISTRLLLAR